MYDWSTRHSIPILGQSAGLHKVSTERPVFHGTEREVDVMRRDLDETRAHSERAALDLVQVSIRLP
jgi:hypothetical protein